LFEVADFFFLVRVIFHRPQKQSEVNRMVSALTPQVRTPVPHRCDAIQNNARHHSEPHKNQTSRAQRTISR
jgi:hypothetical protein